MVRWAPEKFGQPAGRAAFAGLVAESTTGPVPHLEGMAGVWQQVGDRLTDAISAGDLRPDLDVGQMLCVLVGPALMAVVREGDELAIETPRCFGARFDAASGRFGLALEDLTSRQVTFGNVLVPVSRRHGQRR